MGRHHRVPAGLALASLLAAMALSALACSSAPKVPDEVFEVRNQAANFVKLADSLVAKGQYEGAEKFYRQAIDVNSSVDDLEGSSTARSSLGRLLLAWGDLDGALTEYRKAADYARLAASPKAQALAAAGLGEVAFRRGDFEAALASFDVAVTAAGKDEASLAIALHDRASALYALGRKTEARTDLDKAVVLNTKIKRWSELASNRYLLASFLAKEGDLAGAAKAAADALVNDRKSENVAGVTSDLLLLADLSGKLGKDEDAYWYWRRAFDAALGGNLAIAAGKALDGLAESAGKAGREDEVAGWKEMLAKVKALGGT